MQVQRTGTPTIEGWGWLLGATAFATIIPPLRLVLPLVAPGAGALGPTTVAVGAAGALLVAFVAHGRFWAQRYEAAPHVVLWVEFAVRAAFVAAGAGAVALAGGHWDRFLLIGVPWAVVNWRVHQVVVKGLIGYRADAAIVAWGLMLGGLAGAALLAMTI